MPVPGRPADAGAGALPARRRSRMDELTELSFELGDLFADAGAGRDRRGRASRRPRIDLIASHGQTIYHLVRARAAARHPADRPARGDRRAHRRHHDRRSAGGDVAAGGQGAPLVPSSTPSSFATPSGGGRCKTSAASPTSPLSCPTAPCSPLTPGPANSLIDYAARHYSDGAETCDRDGAWPGRAAWTPRCSPSSWPTRTTPRRRPRAPGGSSSAMRMRRGRSAGGRARAGPGGRAGHADRADGADGRRRLSGASGPPGGIDELIVAGGGARNPALLDDAPAPRCRPACASAARTPSACPAKAKEAIAFALLGYEGLHGRPAALRGGPAAPRSWAPSRRAPITGR